MKVSVKAEPTTETHTQFLINDTPLKADHIIQESSKGKVTNSRSSQNQSNNNTGKTVIQSLKEKNNITILKNFLLNPNSANREIGTPDKNNKIHIKREKDGELEANINDTNDTQSVAKYDSSPLAKKPKKEVVKSKKTKDPSLIEREKLPDTTIISPKNPKPLDQLKTLLFNVNQGCEVGKFGNVSDLMDEVFEGLEDLEDLKFCKEQINSPLASWVNYGESLNKKHLELIKELIKLRIELSYKFKIIIALINKCSDSLTENEKSLDDKLSKIKVIGHDILNLL